MLWFGNEKVFLYSGEMSFKNILCYGSANGVKSKITNLKLFKNILCYGSAELQKELCRFLIEFKNILCYGSAAVQAGVKERR